jgi:phosphoglycerate dehydrogenase-like enzyme
VVVAVVVEVGVVVLVGAVVVVVGAVVGVVGAGAVGAELCELTELLELGWPVWLAFAPVPQATLRDSANMSTLKKSFFIG